jgi:hypothetical protein
MPFDALRKENLYFVKSYIPCAAILTGLLALIGCVSSGGIQHASPITIHTPVSIDFARVETSSALGDLEPEKHSLNELVISGLRARDVFGDVEGDKPAAGVSGGMDIKIDITQIKKISVEEREWAGALAGRARIMVGVTVSDLSSGKLIETFDAVGESSGGSNLAGTTDEAVQRAAEQVVAQVIKISRQTGP